MIAKTAVNRPTTFMIIFVLIALCAIFAPWISPQNPYDLAVLDIMDGRLEPGSRSGDGTITYWLGTDDQGRLLNFPAVGPRGAHGSLDVARR